ncbi:MAG: ATP-binding protein [Bacteroidota bacterium]
MYNGSKPVRVLIVDDDEDDFIITSDCIKSIPSGDFIIEWCYTYNDALKNILHHNFDIYLVDYRLGIKTGLDLLKEAVGAGCEEPIVLLTGKGNPSIDKQAMQMGAVDYLVKSDLNAEKLERCIRYSLDRAASTKALRANEKKYRNIFERSKEAIFTTDQKLAFKEVNDAMASLIGLEKNRLLSTNLYKFVEHEVNRAQIKKSLSQQGEVNDLEVEIVNARGRKRNCILFLSLQHDDNNNSYVQGILNDITNQKRSARAALLAEKLATTGRLVRTLAHEVRNPLSNIHMSVEQISNTVRDDDRVYIDIIDRNGKRINDLITELLASFKPTEMVRQKMTLQTAIDESISVAIDRLTLKRIKLEVSYPEFPCYIYGDKEKLRIALLNIIINAVEACESDKGELTIVLTPGEENYVIEITDNGCGIPAENLSKLFEPYFTSKRNGIGLGLASTLNIIQAHHATIEVKSKVNSGSTFMISFNKAT